jgi:plastocyanin
MRTRLFSFTLAAAIIGCGGGGGGDSTPTTPTNPGTPGTPGQPTATTSVEMKGFAFNPPAIVVSPGATVTWTNSDNTNHNVTFSNTAIASTTEFASGSKSIVMPTAAGTYAYTCTLHGGMNGTVKVQ